MPRPRNVKKLFASLKLTPAEAAEMRELLKEDPRVAELRAKREAIDAELAALTGGTAPAAKKPGRKAKAVTEAPKPKGRPGRKPSKAVSAPVAAPLKGKPGRKPKAAKMDVIEGEAATPKKRGRPAKADKAPKAPKAEKVKAPASPAKLAAMAKAREARAAKRAATQA